MSLKNMTDGGALTKIQRRDNAPLKASFASEPVKTTSATSVTDTVKDIRAVSFKIPSTFASDTPPPFNESMDWTMSPYGYVDSGRPTITDEQWSQLPSRVRVKLDAVSEGRGEPRDQTIVDIADFLITSNSDYADQPLIEALAYYADNYLIG